jgi:dTDP-4-amino-4,6-dideoxygalactose transaminase
LGYSAKSAKQTLEQKVQEDRLRAEAEKKKLLYEKEKLIQAIPKSELYTAKDSKKKTDTESKLKQLKKELEELEIDTRPPLTGNFTKQPALKKLLPALSSENNYPMADKISESTFLVACHHDLTDAQVEFLALSLKTIQS